MKITNTRRITKEERRKEKKEQLEHADRFFAGLDKLYKESHK